jgi:hypothetical protein
MYDKFRQHAEEHADETGERVNVNRSIREVARRGFEAIEADE